MARTARALSAPGRMTAIAALSALAVMTLLPARADAYVDGGVLAGTPLAVATGAGNQTDPHVSGSLVSYTSEDSFISYADLSNGSGGAIFRPLDPGSTDVLSDVSGSRIAYVRTDEAGSNIMVFDLATGTSAVLDPQAEGTRTNPAIGGDAVVFEDLGVVRVFDLASGTITELANGSSPAISSDGALVTWMSAGQVHLARRGASNWTTSTTHVVTSFAAGSDPAVDGTGNSGIVAYAGGGDIHWRAVSASGTIGPEQTLTLPGVDIDPSVAGSSIAFHHVQPDGYVDVFLFETLTGILRSVTNTPAIHESLSDVSVRADGSFALVWVVQSALGDDDVLGLVTAPTAVGYAFGGFSAPVNDAPTINEARAGQTIAVKWRLTDAAGAPIADSTSFVSLTSSSASCDPSDATDAIETYSGGSGLQYLGDGTWQFNWKTPKAYAGQCRVMTLTLADGTAYSALFRFK